MNDIIKLIKKRIDAAKEMVNITSGNKEYLRGYNNCLTYFNKDFIKKLENLTKHNNSSKKDCLECYDRICKNRLPPPTQCVVYCSVRKSSPS